VGGFFHKLKKTVGLSNTVVDENAEAHRESFTALVREMKGAFAKENLVLALTVLPNVNASIYYDVPSIIGNVDYVVLTPFDFQTPDRNPKEADYPAPIKALNERNPELNLEAEVGYWMAANAPASKIIVGIPVYGRVWKMTTDSGLTGVPPVAETDGPAEKGPQTEVAGMWSWPEICTKLTNPGNSAQTGAMKPLIRTADPGKRYGTYAYRTADGNGENGLWVGYEEPYTAGLKAKYVREKKLGGIGIFDLSLDDIKGTCQGEKFQMLRAAKYRLDNDN
jgi:chitinase